MVGAAGLDGKLAPQHKIMVGALAVVMPGNLLAISQREDTNLNVRAYGDGFHVLHLIVRLRLDRISAGANATAELGPCSTPTISYSGGRSATPAVKGFGTAIGFHIRDD